MDHACAAVAAVLIRRRCPAPHRDALPSIRGIGGWTRCSVPSGRLSFSLPLLANPALPRVGTLPHGATLSAQRVAALLHPGLRPPGGSGRSALSSGCARSSTRRQLLDVGAAGRSRASWWLCPSLWIGLAYSHAITMRPSPAWSYVGGRRDAPRRFGRAGSPRWCGRRGDADAPSGRFAGWFGMFVTMLNLLPMGSWTWPHRLAATTR